MIFDLFSKSECVKVYCLDAILNIFDRLRPAYFLTPDLDLGIELFIYLFIDVYPLYRELSLLSILSISRQSPLYREKILTPVSPFYRDTVQFIINRVLLFL